MDIDRFTGYVRRCADDYGMLERGDRVAVGVSGGKDSMALLAALHRLRRYHPSGFELEAVTIDMGFPGMDFAPVAAWCAERGLPYTIIKTDIREIVFDARGEDNPFILIFLSFFLPLFPSFPFQLRWFNLCSRRSVPPILRFQSNYCSFS